MARLPDLPVFYTPTGPDLTGVVTLADAEFRHAASVLRLEAGSRILAADGAGRYYECVVGTLGKKSLTASVTGMHHRDRDARFELVLAVAMIKNRQRLEWMLEKATELGASAIVLFRSERSEREKIRTDRLENILVSALKQSRRFYLPRLSESSSLDDVLTRHTGFELLVAHEKTDSSAPFTPSAVPRKLLFIGPEGGFTDPEIELLANRGATIVSLGPNRLRAETAALALLSRFL